MDADANRTGADMTRTYKIDLSALNAMEQCEYYARQGAGAKKFIAFRPNTPGAVQGFLRGWSATLGGRRVTMEGWPDCFANRPEAVKKAQEFRTACRSYVHDPDSMPCPIMQKAQS